MKLFLFRNAIDYHAAPADFEDDVVLPIDFVPRLRSLVAHAPENWDVIYLGANAEHHSLSRNNPSVLEADDTQRFRRLHRDSIAYPEMVYTSIDSSLSTISAMGRVH